MKPVLRILSRLGHATIGGVERLGAARFFSAILRQSGTSVGAPATGGQGDLPGGRAVADHRADERHVHRHGAGAAGLRDAGPLWRYRVDGVLVALSLVRELGPVVAALLFASRAGSGDDRRDRPDETTEQLSAMEVMAVDPIARVVAPRFWAGVISLPLLAALFSASASMAAIWSACA